MCACESEIWRQSVNRGRPSAHRKFDEAQGRGGSKVLPIQ